MFKTEEIDFSRIKDWEFEFICFELVQRNGFEKVTWRKKGADSGRDIEAKLRIVNPLIEAFEETWFFECKHYSAGVPPSELNSKIAWADAEKPEHLVIIVSSHLTNASRTWINQIKPQKSYKIHVVEGENLKKLLEKYPTLLLMYFASGGINQLLFDTKKNWLTYKFYPSYDQLRLIIVRSKLVELPKEDLAFLFCTYFVNYQKYKAHNLIEKIEDEKIFKSLIPLLRKKGSYGQLLYDPHNAPLLNKVQGFVNDLDNLEGDFFIAGEASFSKPISIEDFGKEDNQTNVDVSKESDLPKEGVYTFYKISEREYIEVVSFRNSSFETEIRIITDMTNWSLMFLLWTLGYKEEFATEVFNKQFIEENNQTE